MRLRVFVLATVGLVLAAAPAYAEVSGSGGNQSHAGGSSVSSGSSQSSSSISTSGGGSVGVVQGSVAGGSSASGSSGSGSGDGSNSSGSSSSGAGVGGQSVGAVQPTALENGVVSNPKLPALDIVGSTQSAKSNRPDVVVWVIAALIVGGLVVLYRRLPRPTAT
jgi:hypothetical protein